MAKRAPFAVHRLIDCGRDVAVIRYDGDPDVFAALAESWLTNEGIERSCEPPAPRLYRMNPIQHEEWSWTLGTPSKPGPGVFLGSVLTVARTAGELGEVAPHGCWRSPCEAKRGERHLLSCPNNQARVKAVCTGLTARWCPVHGYCGCEVPSSGLGGDLADPQCPLHKADSTHAMSDAAPYVTGADQ